MLLTRHAKERLAKRLAKRRKLERIYTELWDFLDRSKRINVKDGIVIFTEGRKSLVCVELPCEKLSKGELLKLLGQLNEEYECVFSDERLVRRTTPTKFLKEIPEGRRCFYINRGKRSLYVGSEPPLLAITLRPAKRREREEVRD
jgi:hypothetical protein